MPNSDVDRWITSVYGRDGDRADWARRAAAAFADGRQFSEPMPRDRFGSTPRRLAGIRRAVEEAKEPATDDVR